MSTAACQPTSPAKASRLLRVSSLPRTHHRSGRKTTARPPATVTASCHEGTQCGMRLPAASALLEGAGDLVALAAGERKRDDPADEESDHHGEQAVHAEHDADREGRSEQQQPDAEIADVGPRDGTRRLTHARPPSVRRPTRAA